MNNTLHIGRLACMALDQTMISHIAIQAYIHCLRYLRLPSCDLNRSIFRDVAEAILRHPTAEPHLSSHTHVRRNCLHIVSQTFYRTLSQSFLTLRRPRPQAVKAKMPPQIKQDLNRSGWETTDFPSVCERCLPDNPYVQMLKEDYGAECKVCTRPFTIFSWKADRTARRKRTSMCLTCARLKNCCQCCMLDLSFGLPIVVRDAALKMVAPGPESHVNREYYAQEHEKEIEEGRGAVEAYEKTDEKARELLRRLAASEPYYKKQRRLEASGEADGSGGPKALLPPMGGESAGEREAALHRPGPLRTRDSRVARGGRGGGGARGGRAFPSAAQLPPGPQDIAPPADTNITSLFVTGVEDDLPEHEIRTYFAKFGKLRSVVCSHRSHCAFINYMTRKEAEAAAEACQGRAVVAAVPLRVQWGKPKVLDTMDREQRMAQARAGRDVARATTGPSAGGAPGSVNAQSSKAARDAELESINALAPPPGSDDVQYASLAGD